jgi:acetyl esterase/lipase
MVIGCFFREENAGRNAPRHYFDRPASGLIVTDFKRDVESGELMPSVEHDGIVALITSEPRRGHSDDPVAESRAALDAMGQLFAVPDDVAVDPLVVAGRRAEWLRPRDVEPGRHLLYLHGGAYVAGSLDSHRSLVARLARAMRATAVHLDYRLAPEHPFPAGLDDAVSLVQHLEQLGVDAKNLIVAGDSAGGGLAVALTLRLRDLRKPLPRALVLLSPWLDLTMTSKECVELQAGDPMLDASSLLDSATLYAAGKLQDPLVSPVFAQFADVPPALVFVSTTEILVADSRTFTERVRAAQGSVELHEFEGLIHVWPFVDGLPETTAVMDDVARFIDRQFS